MALDDGCPGREQATCLVDLRVAGRASVVNRTIVTTGRHAVAIRRLRVPVVQFESQPPCFLAQKRKRPRA
jgi:hypothetical protein